jgi:hypothetical protein
LARCLVVGTRRLGIHGIDDAVVVVVVFVIVNVRNVRNVNDLIIQSIHFWHWKIDFILFYS